MRRTSLLLGFVAVASLAAFACGATKKSSFDDGFDAGNGSAGGVLGGGEGGVGEGCSPGKGNFDIPGNNCDDDDDGTVDNPPSCDDSPGSSPEDFAKAIGICATVAKDGYGLVSATFTQGGGDQHGVLPKFGNVLKPREGSSLGVLSSGYAQEYDGQSGKRFGGESLDDTTGDEASQDWGTDGTLPPGFPKAASGCDQAEDVHDVVSLKLKLKAPNNASGIQFDFNFFSSEWPAYICSRFNDGFIAYLSAPGFNGGTPDNISFDAKKNPISVNNGFFDRCTAGVDTGCAPGAVPAVSACPGGTSELGGTGFGITGKFCEAYGMFGGAGGDKTSTSGGATGWLTSSAPVGAGEEFTLELTIWDTGDGVLDSSILVDNFSWAQGEVVVSTDRPK